MFGHWGETSLYFQRNCEVKQTSLNLSEQLRPLITACVIQITETQTHLLSPNTPESLQQPESLPVTCSTNTKFTGKDSDQKCGVVSPKTSREMFFKVSSLNWSGQPHTWRSKRLPHVSQLLNKSSMGDCIWLNVFRYSTLPYLPL